MGFNYAAGGMAQGLNEAIKGYLGDTVNFQKTQANEQYKSDLETQRQSKLQDAELKKEAAMAQFKRTIQGRMSPEQADTLVPGSSNWVNQYKTTNGELPTLEDGIKALAERAKGADKNENQAANHLLRAQGMYNTNVKKEQDSMHEATTASDQIKAALNNPVANSAVPITLARMMTGTSRININEINRLGGSQAVLDRLNQIGKTMAKGTLTQDNAQYMSGLVGILAQSHQKNISDLGLKHAKQWQRVSGQPLDKAYQDITGEDMPDQTPHDNKGVGGPKADPLGLFK